MDEPTVERIFYTPSGTHRLRHLRPGMLAFDRRDIGQGEDALHKPWQTHLNVQPSSDLDPACISVPSAMAGQEPEVPDAAAESKTKLLQGGCG